MPSQTPNWKMHFAAIIESSDDAIVSKDLNGVVQSWNSAAERIFGHSALEMIGQPITKIIPRERLEEEPVILKKIRSGERVDHFETVRQRKDGRRIYVSVTISPIRDDDGKIVGVSKIARDITAAKRVERERDRLFSLGKIMALEPSLETLSQAVIDAALELSGAQGGLFLYDMVHEAGLQRTLQATSGTWPAERIAWLSQGGSALFNPAHLKAEAIRSADVTRDERFAGAAMPWPIRSYVAMPIWLRTGAVNGGIFLWHEAAGAFDAETEAVLSNIAIPASIALDNARLRVAVQENLERFQQLANTIPQLAWMARKNGDIFWYNQRWYEYTGTKQENQVGWGWERVHDPRELPRVLEKWKQALESGKPWEDTFPLRGHDGSYRTFLSRAQPFRDRVGDIVLWFGTNTDVSDQQALMREREELLASERAARSNAERTSRMKDEFLATLSHELRTPLNAIMGWCQLMYKADDATVAEGLEVIERNARTQTQLIEDLLDMSRIISGKLRLDVQSADLTQVIHAAMESVKPAANSKEIDLRQVLDPRAGPVSGDPTRLQQVIWNLLSNAIKFTPKRGKVAVLLERVNSHIEITVTDTGEGIDPEFLPFVFDRFRQADSTTTRQHRGLGLGLSIAKQLVELHGGQIRVKSAGKGQGTTFSINLPLAVVHDASLDRQHPRGMGETRLSEMGSITLKGVRVLLVEDEPDAREVIRRLLTERQAEVVVAGSADEGLSMVQRHLPDVIVSDIGMPVKDGYQFLKEVRRLPAERGGRTAAVALTAFARSEDRTRAMLAGYQVHISKPIEGQELVATVAGVCGRAG